MPDNDNRIVLPTSSNFTMEEFNPLKKLDSLQGKEREKYLEFLEKSGIIAPGNDGFFTELGQGMAQGVVSGLAGLGRTLEDVGLGSGVKEYAEDVLRRNKQWNPHEDYSAFSLNPGNIGRTLGQGIGSTAATLGTTVAATALTGNPVIGAAAGAGVTFAQIYGDTVEEFKKSMPNQDQGTIRGLAFYSAAGQSLIETLLGPEKVFAGLTKGLVTNALKQTTQSFVKRLGKEAAKQSIAEGSEEVAQDFWNRCVQAMGTKNFQLPSWSEVREQFFGGAIPGGVLGGIGGSVASNASQDAPVQIAPEDVQTLPQTPAMPGVEPEQTAPVSNIDTLPASARLVDEVGKALGLNVRYFDEEGAPEATDGAGNAVNGWYDKDKNEFWINRQDPNMNPLETLGHEFKHKLDNDFGDWAENFNKLLLENVNEEGKAAIEKAESDYAAAGMAGRGFTEFAADTVGKMWTDPQFWQDVATRAEQMNAGMGQKMLQALQDFIKVVKNKLKSIGTPEAKQLFDNLNTLRDEVVKITAEVRQKQLAKEKQDNVASDISDGRLPEFVPVDQINLDPERFQFKENKDKSGVVNKLDGTFDQEQARPLFLWEDKQGKRNVVEGHHRLDLARRSGTKDILAYIHKESEGETAEDARKRGVLMNIHDNKGSVRDFAEFFRGDDITYDEAKKQGLFRKDEPEPEQGFIIGKYAGDTLYSAFRNDDINAEKAAVIADAARGDEGLEAAGLKKAPSMGIEHLAEYMKLLKKLPREKDEQGDLFGFDDSAIIEADKVSALALKHQKKLLEMINSGKGAIKRPNAAKGVGVSGSKNSAKLLEEAQKELARYEHYETDHELYQQLLEEAGLKKKEDVSETENTTAPEEVVSAENAQTTPVEDDADGLFDTQEETVSKKESVEPVIKENLTTENAATTKESLEVKPEESEVEKSENAANNFSQGIRDIINSNDNSLGKKIALFKLGQANGIVSNKKMEELCEAEIVAMAREINAENISDDDKYKKLIELYNKQPNLSKRTSTSVANQAYSTPVPLAWALGKRIGLQGKTVYEPTAGTGMLTIAGNPKTITVNEIDTVRKSILEKQGFAKVTSNDASVGKPNKKFDRIIMNPPFDSANPVLFSGYKLTKLDHIIAARALEAMKDDGKAAIIIGANTEKKGGEGKANYADYVFRSYLYSNFNVKDDFIVDGILYRKQGASYPVRVITVSGKKSVADNIEAPEGLEIINDWSTLYNKLQGEIENEISGTERNAGTHSGTGAVEDESTVTAESERRPQRERKSVGEDSGNSQGGQRGVSGRSSERHESESGRSGSMVQNRPERGRVSEPAESGSDNGPRMGDSTADLHGKTEGNGNQSGSVDDGGRSGGTRTRTSVRAELRPNESPAPAERVQVGEKRGELNNSYVPASRSTDKMDVVVPRFMAEALEESLSKVEQQVGPIDKFVQDELGYDTLDDLYKALSDVQIDGVAQAIHAVKNNTGFILGDQTGIGKGRQCAAMIRWAQKHGVVPVFFTRDQNLFTDMYRDGKDIGTVFNPLLIASDANKANINDANGKKIVGIPKNLQNAFDNFLKENSEYDCVFCPYSQLSQANKQREFLSNLSRSRKCLFIMDEAHEAAGDSSRGRFFYGEGGVLQNSFVNVVYASATFAKRPDNMALYFRTNIKDAVDNIDSLKEVLSRGGVPLQQLLSANLAKDGQYTRRERDFTGVNFDTVVADLDKEEKANLIDRFDRVASVLGDMIRYSEELRDAINASVKEKRGSANTREKQSVSMASFSSVTHNYIAQLLLASKCDIVVQEAEKAVKVEQKPVIALTNTLESVLSEFVEDNDIAIDDVLSMRYSDILESALLRMYKYTEKTSKGEKVTRYINIDDIGFRDKHEKMVGIIHELDDINLPVSPIDYIKQQLENKGIKTGEITGRKLTVDYSKTEPTLASRSPKEANKNKNVNDFNSGKTDAIILNASGSTGLSLHSSKKFADQKQRNMIMAQPSLDIAVVQQMFGRVLRSGQVNSPVYKILSSPLAAERRPMMVLSRKLQSLNANTTANNKGAVSLGVDFMNKYGDLIAQQYLDDNPDIAMELDLDTDSTKTSETSAPDGLITKFTGRMAVLSDSQQQDILDDLVARYSNLIDFLKKTGNYDLEITVHDDWDAITREENTIMPGDTNGSMFKQPVVLKKIDIKEMKNIRSVEDVQNDIKENLGNDVYDKLQKDFAKAEDGINNLEKSYKSGEKPIEFINDRKTLLQRTLDDFKSFVIKNSGRMLELTIGEDNYTGILTGYHVVGKHSDRSPVIASKLMLEFAVSDSVGKITIPYSRFQGQGVTYTGSFLSMRDAFTGEKQAVREERYAVTGNLLRGLEYTESGKVVSYKTHDGDVESALLLPKSWEPAKLVRDPRNEIKTVDEALKELSEDRGVLRSNDGLVIYSVYGRKFIDVPRSKRDGGKYYLDKKLLDIVGGDFSSWGRVMRSHNLDDKQLKKAIEYILSMDDVYLRKNNKEYSLRRHDQVNPIRGDGAFKDEYQEKLDDETFKSRSNAEVNRRAAQRIALFGGMKATAQMILDGDIVGTSDVGQRVMQLVLNSPEYQNMDADQRDRIADIYINQSGTEIARALAARRLGVLKLNDIKSIQAHINVLLAKLDKLKPGNTIRKQILDEFGVDIANLPEDIIDSPEKIDALVRKLASERASKMDKAYEFWINAILSGPVTHTANIAGNVSNAVYELGVKRFVEAAINVVSKKKDGATFGEFKNILHTVNWKEAKRRAIQAFQLETLGVDNDKLESVRIAIGGKLGRAIRTPGRLLRAADEFAKAIIQPMEAAVFAYRQGKKLKMSGAELQEYMKQQIMDGESAANEYGHSRAIELTFQKEPGTAVKQLINWREAGGVMGTILKFTVPFLRTPSNILEQGIRKSPLGLASFAWETGKLLLGKRKFDNDYIGRFAEQIIAWGIVASFIVGDDEDDLPVITGTSPRYGSAEQKFKVNKVPAYSIKIGDTYFSYKRIDPLSSGLAVIADGINALRDVKNGQEATKVMKKLVGGIKQLVVEKSFLDSLGEINRVASDPERSMAKFATNFASSWMPNVVRQTLNVFDDNVRDTKSRSKGAEWWEDQFKIITDRMGITKASPKIDYFGREISKDALENSGALRLARLLPVQAVSADSNMNDAERLIWNWNHNNPNNEYYPDVPSYYFRRNNKKYYFSGEDYQQFAKESGQLALRQINNAIRHGLLNIDNPTEKDIKLIKAIFTKARSLTRDKMFWEGKYSE